jgi:hypothetical protein
MKYNVPVVTYHSILYQTHCSEVWMSLQDPITFFSKHSPMNKIYIIIIINLHKLHFEQQIYIIVDLFCENEFLIAISH